MEAQAFIILILTQSFLAPVVTSLINRPQWSRELRQGIAIGVALGIGLLAMWGTGGFTGQWFVDLTLAITLSTFAYETLWKPTGAAEVVEKASSPSPK